MNKFWVIVFHTYLNKLKTKSFIITTIITALILVALTNMEKIIDVFNSDDNGTNVGVIYDVESVYTLFKQNVNVMDKDIHLKEFTSESKAKQAVESGELDSYLLLSLNDKQLPQAVYKANSLAESNLSSTLEQAVQQTKVAMATVKIGLEEKQIDQLYSP
ncbi:hypothetical protein DMN50_17545, partial [Priestia megaterium]